MEVKVSKMFKYWKIYTYDDFTIYMSRDSALLLGQHYATESTDLTIKSVGTRSPHGPISLSLSDLSNLSKILVQKFVKMSTTNIRSDDDNKIEN